MAEPVPSIDELQSLIAKIQIAAKTYDPNADPVTAVGQRALLRGAANDLCNAMSTPMETVWRKVSNMTELVALRTALRLGVFSTIPEEGSISNSELAKKVNATESLIERQLRILVATGMIDRTDSDVTEYKHNHKSKSFVDTTKPSPGTFFQAMYDIYFRTTMSFDQYMLKTKQNGLYSEPSSNFRNPFLDHYGKDGESIWDVMGAMPDLMQLFQLCLIGVDVIVPPTGAFYDFSQFKASGPDDDRIQIVDVGGGYGKVLTQIVSVHKELDPKKCILQDIEHVIGISHDAQAAGLQTQVIDFHKAQPVQGAKAYYMRFITHDYSDPDLVNILSHISAAMAPDSKLLFADSVIPARLVEATLAAGVLDQMMFCIGGKERTEADFKDVLSQVGLRLVKVYPVLGTGGAIIESQKIPVQTNGVHSNGVHTNGVHTNGVA